MGALVFSFLGIGHLEVVEAGVSHCEMKTDNVLRKRRMVARGASPEGGLLHRLYSLQNT